MSYADKFDQKIELAAISEAEELAVKVVMKEGELRFRDALIQTLESEVAGVEQAEVNQDWLDGVGYCLHLVRNGDFGVNERGA